MKTSLLNKTLILKRISSSITASGAESNEVENLGTFLGRITKNNPDERMPIKGEGIVVFSTHKIFSLTTSGVENGDYIYDGNSIYNVVYVDKIPGGKTDSHYEIYVNLVDVNTDVSLSEVS